MATRATQGGSARQGTVAGGSRRGASGNVGSDVGNQSAQTGSMAWLVTALIGAVIFAILLPLILMLYIEVSTLTKQVKIEVRKVHEERVKVEKIRKEIEDEK